MARFDIDWATGKIASQYAGHLRSTARSNNELAADTHYSYLKANSAKRRKDAPRGARLGLANGQADANDERQDPGPSEAGPSSLPNVNNDIDEMLMDDSPGLFGSNNLSDDEDEGDEDADGAENDMDPE